MHWKTTTVLVCLYGVLKRFRPGTPFLTPFLVSSEKNLTVEQVYGDVYPYWTYAYLLFMIPALILTDLLRYKPLIIVEAASLAATWSLLVFGHGLFLMQLMQICFGFSSAAELAYYSYMYAVVDERNYKRVASYIRSAALVGKLFAFAIAQFLVSFDLGSLLLLQEISLGACCLVTVIALLLPSVPSPKCEKQVRIRAIGKRSQVNDTGTPDNCDIEGDEEAPLSRSEAERRKLSGGVRMYFSLTARSLLIYRDSRAVLTWSVWWALATCGCYQIGNYSQTLWIEMQPDVAENGLAEMANTLTSALLSFLIQFVSFDWSRWGALTLSVSSLLIAVLLYISAKTTEIYVAYGCYATTSAVYHMLITAASWNIASRLPSSNYGLVFGVNTFVALILQSLLTLIVADSHGLNLHIRDQFIIYSAYFAVVGLVVPASFGLTRCFHWIRPPRPTENPDQLAECH